MRGISWCKGLLEDGLDGRLFYWIPVIIGAGILYYFSLLGEPLLPAVMIGIGIFSFLSWYAYKDQKFWQAGLLLIPALFLLGMFLAQIRTLSIETTFLTEEGLYRISGIVKDIEADEKAHRVLLKDIQLEDKKAEGVNLQYVRIRSYHADNLKPGDQISVLASLKSPSGPTWPGGFDFRRYAFFRHLSAVGYTVSDFDILNEGDKAATGRLSSLRYQINQSLNEIENLESRGVAKALLTGDRSAVPEDVLEDIRDAGLAHLLSISGLHVGLVAGFIFLLIRTSLAWFPSIALRYPIKKIAAIGGLFSACFYALLVGMPVPTQRAVLMTGLVFTAIILDRSPISFRLVTIAALIIMLFKPEAIVEVSFQLSFSAVIFLIAFYEWFYKNMSHKFMNKGPVSQCGLYFLGVVITTIIASIATAPLTLYHFQHFATYGVLSNVVAVPLMSFIIMPGLIIALILMPFQLEGGLLNILDIFIRQVIDVAHYTANLEGAVFHSSFWPVSAISLFVFGGLILVFTKGKLRYLSFVFFILSFVPILMTSLPNILIADQSQLIGVYKEGRFYLNTTSKDKYTAEQWGNIYGLKPEQFLEMDNCYDGACTMSLNEKRISYLTNMHGLAEECQKADILILSYGLDNESQCKARHFDRFDTWRHGAHALYIQGDKIRTKTTDKAVGNRPWTQ